MSTETVMVRVGWICLALMSLGILGFGVVEVVAPGNTDSLPVREFFPPAARGGAE